MAELAREEIDELQQQLEQQGEGLKFLLLPKDPLDEKNIMLEVGGRAGGRAGAVPLLPLALPLPPPLLLNNGGLPPVLRRRCGRAPAARRRRSGQRISSACTKNMPTRRCAASCCQGSGSWHGALLIAI